MLAQPLSKEKYASMKTKQYNESIFGKSTFRREYIEQFKVASAVPQVGENDFVQIDVNKLEKL